MQAAPFTTAARQAIRRSRLALPGSPHLESEVP